MNNQIQQMLDIFKTYPEGSFASVGIVFLQIDSTKSLEYAQAKKLCIYIKQCINYEELALWSRGREDDSCWTDTGSIPM